jgi:hypothetical protein
LYPGLLVPQSVYIGGRDRRKETTRKTKIMDNNKMDLRETGCDGMDWIDVAQDRDQWRDPVSTVMNFRVR